MMMMMTMTPTFLMKQLKPRMTMTTMSFDPIIPLLTIGHPSKSQIVRALQIMMMLQNPNFYFFGYIWMF